MHLAWSFKMQYPSFGNAEGQDHDPEERKGFPSQAIDQWVGQWGFRPTSPQGRIEAGDFRENQASPSPSETSAAVSSTELMA